MENLGKIIVNHGKNYGKSTEHQWNVVVFYGKSVENLWKFVVFYENPWNSYGILVFSVEILWSIIVNYGKAMEIIRIH